MCCKATATNQESNILVTILETGTWKIKTDLIKICLKRPNIGRDVDNFFNILCFINFVSVFSLFRNYFPLEPCMFFLLTRQSFRHVMFLEKIFILCSMHFYYFEILSALKKCVTSYLNKVEFLLHKNALCQFQLNFTHFF